jgi:hypothetical protein
MPANPARYATVLRVIGLAIIGLAAYVTVDLYDSTRSPANSWWNSAANFAGLSISGLLVLAATDRIRGASGLAHPALYVVAALAAFIIQAGALANSTHLFRDPDWVTVFRIVAALSHPLLLVALSVDNNRLQWRSIGLQLAAVIVLAALALGAKQAHDTPFTQLHIFLLNTLYQVAMAIVLALVVSRRALAEASSYDRPLALLLVMLLVIRLADATWMSFNIDLATPWLPMQVTVLMFLLVLVGLVLTRSVQAPLFVPLALLAAIVAAVASIGLQSDFTDTRKVSVFLVTSLGSYGLAALAVALNFAIASEDKEAGLMNEAEPTPPEYGSLASTT